MTRPTYLHIDLSALSHNFKRVKALVGSRSIMAMVKANAYGHGLIPIAKGLSQAELLGVASLEEAIKLREAGILTNIILMEGLFSAAEVEEAIKHQVSLVVHHLSQVEMLERSSYQQKPFWVWIKINTGMNRLGIKPDQLNDVYQRLLKLKIVMKPIGLMTHFADADALNSETTLHQQKIFETITKGLPGPRSLANSAGILAWPTTYADWVRPGLMLYGASPFKNHTGFDHGLKPVMTLTSRLIAINEVKQGDRVGYGGTWTAPKAMRIGVVGVGYGDGYPQATRNGAPVLVNGVQCALAGRVSMDMITVDLDHQPAAQIGDEVVLWGEHLPVEMIAEYSGSTAYEILTRMTARPKVILK